MTDTCATCKSFAADPSGTTGKCRRQPPTQYQWPQTVNATDWCAEFADTDTGTSGLSYVSITAAAPQAGGFFLFAVRSDGLVYQSTNGGAWSAYTALPSLP